jgi:hypothetical protein
MAAKFSADIYRRVAINLMHQIRADRSKPTSSGYDKETVDALASLFSEGKTNEWWKVI